MKKTGKDIEKLREAFRIEYKKFQKTYSEMGNKMYELSKQADILLGFMSELNKLELDINKIYET